MASKPAGLVRVASAVLTVLSIANSALAQDATVDRLKGFRYGDDPAILEAITQRVNEARANSTQRFYVARALAEVLSSDAAFDAKQFACRQLAFVGGEEQVPALAKLLSDEQLAHYALMALSRIPGKAVDDALRANFQPPHRRTRIEIADAMGERGDRGAVPQLVDVLGSQDEDYHQAAAVALAKIADEPALTALKKDFAKGDAKRRKSTGDALLFAANRLRQSSDPQRSLPLFILVNRDSGDPILQAGALRGIATTAGERAFPAIEKALMEEGTRRQAVGADAARYLPGPTVTKRFAQLLPSLTPRGKLLLATALADRGDKAAGPSVASLTADPDPSVRLGAIRALATLGDATTVGSLVKAAAGGNAEVREAALSSISRLKGKEVDARLLALAQTAPAKIKIQAIEGLGRRKVSSGLPALLAAAKSKEPGVSAASLRVLRDLGGADLLPALLELLVTMPAGNRSEVSETISEIARRGTTESQRTGLLLHRLGKTTAPADRVELFAILRQVGGASALAALRAGASDPNADVRTGAIRQLAEWPTAEPMPELLKALKNAKDRRQRTLALRGYIRLIGLDEQRSPGDALRLYREAAALTTTADEKRAILGGLGKVHTLGALELASTYLKDPDLRAEAELAVVETARATAGAYPQQTRAALEPIAETSDNAEAKNRAKAILDVMSKFGDFVTAWEVSPAYDKATVGYSELFNIAFPPEDAARAEQVGWRLMPAGTTPAQPWLLDLLALHGGEQKVAYLRTAVWSEKPQDLTLELGSDDGLKIWCNGKLVHSNNVARAAAPGQDKVAVSLQQGRNDLLVKVTQNVMGWGACARFTGPTGEPAHGLKFTIPSDK